MQSSDGYLFFGTQLGVDRYDGAQFIHISMPDINPDLLSIRDLCEDSNGNIWILSDGGVCRLEAGEYSATFVNGFGESAPRRMVSAGNGEYLCFVERDSTLYTYNITTGIKTRIAGNIRFMCSDGFDKLFFNDTYGHLYVSSLSDSIKERIVIDKFSDLSMTEMPLLQDGQPDWTGATRLRYAGNFLFLALKGAPCIALNLKNHRCKVLDFSRMYDAVRLRSGDYFIASDGISLRDSNLVETCHFENEGGNAPFIDHFTNTICLDREKGLWVGTRYHGIYHFTDNYSNLSIIDFARTNNLTEAYTTAFGPGRLNSVVIRTENAGMLEYDTDTGNIRTSTYNKVYYPPQRAVFNDSIEFSRSNYLIFRDNGKQKRLVNTPSIRNSAILSCKDGHSLWIASETDGLYKMDVNGETFEKIDIGGDERNGCNVGGLCYDSAGLLWIISDKGICYFNESDNTVRSFSSSDGFPTTGYTGAVSFLKDGKIYVGMLNGFLSFSPEFSAENFSAHRILFTDFRRLGNDGARLYPMRPLTSSAITLPYESNSFSIGVSDLSFATPSVSSLQYRISDLSDSWTDVNGGRITIANLRHGRHTLQVRQNPDWPVSGSTAELKIKVLRHPLASITAFIIYSILITGTFLLSIYMVRKKERRKALIESEMKAAKNAKKLYTSKIEALSDIAFKVGTPLTLLKSISDSMKTRFSKSPDSSLASDVILMSRSIDNISSTINEFAGMNSLEDIPSTENPAECDIVGIINSVYRRYTLPARKKGLSYELKAPEHISASIDRVMLEKILSCLLSNAVKFSSKGFSVHVEVIGDTIQITEETDGEIIPVVLREKIFEPFYQLPGHNNEYKSISGLGLHLGRNLATKMGGSLKMDNDSSANRFILSLPLRHLSDMITAPVDKPSGKPVLIIADNNADFRTYMERQFRDAFNVMPFNDGKSVLNHLHTSNMLLPDIIISEVFLPGESGFEVCAHLKSNPLTCHIPVILYSSADKESSQAISDKSGADLFLQKPFPMERLFSGINNLIEGRKRLKEHYGRTGMAAFEQVATSHGAKIISNLDEFLLDNLSIVSLSVEDMASALNMSVSNLQKRLKSLVGMTPIEYLNDFRMNRAAKLMENDELSVLEISIRTGYDSQTYFTKVFKKHFGLSPREYRGKLIRKQG